MTKTTEQTQCEDAAKRLRVALEGKREPKATDMPPAFEDLFRGFRQKGGRDEHTR